jgi:hypothetical protein
MPVDVPLFDAERHIILTVCVRLDPQAGQMGACITRPAI